MNRTEFNALKKIAYVGEILTGKDGAKHLDRYLRVNGYNDNQIERVIDADLSDDMTTLGVEFIHGTEGDVGYVYATVDEEGGVRLEF